MQDRTATGRERPRLDHAALVVIDVQQRLAPAMAEFGRVVLNLRRLIRGFQLLERPVFVTEQYPRGLGPTLPSVADLVPGPYHEKVAFSCCGCASFSVAAEPHEDWVLCGIEAHVCVMQTALDGQVRGHRLFVASDAVTSRSATNRTAALAHLAAAGVTVLPTEALLFSLLGAAGTEVFKSVSRLVR